MGRRGYVELRACNHYQRGTKRLGKDKETPFRVSPLSVSVGSYVWPKQSTVWPENLAGILIWRIGERSTKLNSANIFCMTSL